MREKGANMRRRPLVSVIVPAHNASAFVAETLRSIQAQTFQNWECVVVDDGSTDETAALAAMVVDGDDRFRVIRQQASGVSIARNRGFSESSPDSKYIAFMDADDRWKEDALAVLLEKSWGFERGIGAHGLAELIDSNGRVFREGEFEAFGRRRLGYEFGLIREWPTELPTCFATLCWTGPIYPPGVLVVRRQAYEKAGLFDPEMRLCEDWDMAIRLSRVGDIAFLNRVVVQYRKHLSNASNNLRGNRAAVRRLYHKTFNSPENRPEHRAVLGAGWLAWQRYKIREKWRDACRGIRRGDVKETLGALISTPLYLARYLKGAPGGGLL